MTALAGRRISLPRRIRWRPGPRTVALLAALLVGVTGGWLWLRDSPLVAVQRVTIAGVRGPDADRIRHALRAAALAMTTLDVSEAALDMAVAPFPIVKRLDVTTQFPHAMRIRVVEQSAVAEVTVDGRAVLVAADGTLLREGSGRGGLPQIPLRVPPIGARLTDRGALAAVAVLGAAPWPLLGRIETIAAEPGRGVVAQFRQGPQLIFGDGNRLADKWIAAVKVLADAGSRGAAYVDVTVPGRPAAGNGGAAGRGAIGSSAGMSPAATPAAQPGAAATPTATVSGG